MLDFVFAIIAAGVNGSGGQVDLEGAETAAVPAPVTAPEATSDAAAAPTVVIGENTTVGAGVVIGGAGLLEGTADQVAPPAPADDGFNMSVVPAGLVAEPQTPSGKFTTATEIKPILGATKGNWVAVREFNGQDLLYVTHLWGWRCGLHAMAISVNDEPMQNWPLPPCHTEYATPNAILEEDGLPYLTMRLKSVEKIDIQIVYDDLSMEAASFQRGDVLIP